MFKDNPFYKGAALILVSELFLVLSGMSIKQVSAELPTEMTVFIRNLFGVILLLPWLAKNGADALKTSLLRFHLMRAAVGVTAMTCLFYSWGHLPLAQAALLKQTAPFFIPFIAMLWLGERVTRAAKLAIVVGFAGVYAVLNPQDGALNIAVLIAVFGAMLGGLAKVTIRRMSATESPQRIVFYFGFFSAIFAAVPAALVWVTPSLAQFGWLVALAVTSTSAQLLLSKGYSYAPAGQLGPFTYGSVAFAALFGWLFWDELLDWNTFLGVVLIIAAGIITLRGSTTSESRAAPAKS